MGIISLYTTGTALPTGTVTFLFSDIEGSATLAQNYPDAMSFLLERHNTILRQSIEAHNGVVFQIIGDAFCVAFHTAGDALRAAIKSQVDLQGEDWGDTPVKVRMGIHTGEAELQAKGDYHGYLAMSRVQRLMSAGHGGQILISQATQELIRDKLPKDVTLRDMGEHKLKDVPLPVRIFQVSAPDLQKDFPALRTLNVFPNNLPTQITSFVGREKELADVKKLLYDAHILTLIGPGGTGKTRLSIQLGTELLSQFSDGVWFIELAPLADPALILQTIASVLGVRSQTGMPLENIVNDYLRAKNLLLIFDNCEHLVEASAALADDFLHNAPQVKIIASSREALGIGGETVYRVPSLSSPNQAQVTREAVMGFESVQLFVERASAANPKFHLTDENASHVAQICSRLDGIPLALELAASRVSAFTPEQIAKRLDDRFKLLTGGSRTALPRQQTLRALIDWSYDILSPDECKLLKRLSVFAGGWMFEAAEAMFDDIDVLELLPQLPDALLPDVQRDDLRDVPALLQVADDRLSHSSGAQRRDDLVGTEPCSLGEHDRERIVSGREPPRSATANPPVRGGVFRTLSVIYVNALPG